MMREEDANSTLKGADPGGNQTQDLCQYSPPQCENQNKKSRLIQLFHAHHYSICMVISDNKHYITK